MDNEPHSAPEPVAALNEGEPPPPRLCSHQVKFIGGVESEEQAQRISDVVRNIALPFSRYYPLEKLDGITFAEDYAAALRALDRGFDTDNSLTATAETFAMGVAMSPMVRRDGVIKTHIVLSSGIGQMLLSEDNETFELAANVVAHEFGHVSFNQMCDEAVPNMYLMPVEDDYERCLYPHSCDCLDEYIATRRSSFIGTNQLEGYRDTLISICNQSRETLLAARKSYRENENYNELSHSTFSAIGRIMKFSGYVLGQADGEGRDAFDTDGRLEEAFDSLDLREWFSDLHDRLLQFHDRLPDISSAEDFLEFNRSVEEGARIHGVHSRRAENGQQWVDIEMRVHWMDD